MWYSGIWFVDIQVTIISNKYSNLYWLLRFQTDLEFNKSRITRLWFCLTMYQIKIIRTGKLRVCAKNWRIDFSHLVIVSNLMFLIWHWHKKEQLMYEFIENARCCRYLELVQMGAIPTSKKSTRPFGNFQVFFGHRYLVWYKNEMTL